MTVLLDTPGNVRSIEYACARLGKSVERTLDPQVMAKAERLILPGQGRFGTVARILQEPKLRKAVLEACQTIPVLAICVGMQVLFEGSEEDPEVSGLGLLPGVVRSMDGVRLPQMGWNHVEGPDWQWPGDYYFANSYCCPDEGAIAYLDYGGKRCAAVQRGGVLGVQFHPEKSGALGETVLEAFLC